MSLTPEQRAVLTATEGAMHDLAEVDDLPEQNLAANVVALVVSLAEARRDAERIGFAIHRGLIVAGMPLGLGWVYTPLDECAGGGDAFKLTREIREHIDAARAAEEPTNG